MLVADTSTIDGMTAALCSPVIATPSPVSVFLAAGDALAAGISRRLEQDGHRVQCATSASETARALAAMHTGTKQPADMIILQARLLTDRAHAALRSLRARDRSSVLVLIAGEHDSAGRRLAAWLGASIAAEPPSAEDIELIAEWARAPGIASAGNGAT